MTSNLIPVGIVGAGPVGMALAARLASFGIPSVLFERDPELRKQGSKACLIQGDVLEVLDKFGCAETIGAEGVTWTTARTYVRGKEIRAAEYPRRIGYGPFVNISQFRIEQLLLEKIQESPLTEVHWAHEITAVSQDDDAVTVTADTPDGPRSYTCRYVVACDGVRSPMRKMTGVAWTGYSHKDRFLITDLKVKLPLPKERHFHYDPPFNPGRQLVMHPQPNDIWRIDWQLAPETDIEAERADGRFDRRVRAVIGDVDYEIDWVSTYRFHQRVVEKFRLGRIFFAGDSAHSLPPYGSRGMNSGIQDADNLAWKLALVMEGKAEDSLLDTYHDERYAAAKENLAVTEATIKFMVPPTLARRWARKVLLTLSHPFQRVRDRVNSGKMAEPHTYTASPVVESADRHPLLGSFAPDARVAAPGVRRVRELYGQGFTGLYFAPDRAAAREFAERALADTRGLDARLVVVLREGERAVPTAGDASDMPAGVTVLRDRDSVLSHAYRAAEGSCLIVRPDGHIAALLPDASRPEGFGASLSRCAQAVTPSVAARVVAAA
ncbi:MULTISPECIES: FAD-dependent monooxygenase [Streptomyces]|uniref:FAD-dependent monooxygenase n=1 Tax=Streptomyces chilikensis TaxID=1194079 RepID=A0ABV3EVP7_9ACTN|nr:MULTISPECIES: FAD-dependent monooxygenase [Streptomyces]MDH6226749.1 3-(3-hydroxy-phenyl)propionate hydroxylase [Streptomyces sp. MJP52]